MSKVVKGIGSAISGVTRAVGKVVQGAVNVVKKVVKSPIGKAISIAAAVYFTGGAVLGAMGGAAAGTGVMGTIAGAVSGAGAGISSAWAGLTGAAGALAGGQGLAAAGSSLSGGLTGAYAAGSGSVLGAAGTGLTMGAGGATGLTAPASSLTSGSLAATGGGAGTGLTASANALAPTIGAPTASPGLISSVWNGLGDYGRYGAIQAAGKVVEGVGQQKAAEEQRTYEQDQAQLARDRYNQNVGTNWWPSQSAGAAQPPSGPSTYAQAAPSGLVSGAMTPRQQYEEEMRRQQETYSPYQLRTA